MQTTHSNTGDELAFITRCPDAAMISVRADGSPHAARVELGIVAGRIRTSGSPKLVRTANVSRDPRCTLFVFGPPPLWLGIDAIANILDGPDAVDHGIDLMLARHGRHGSRGLLAHDDELGADRHYELDEYRDHARAQNLFVFDFDVIRTYGNYTQSGDERVCARASDGILKQPGTSANTA
ncbi:MAG: pyridoxamine 5'-phosphate oxidase family protein [Mycobacterium sp.]|nr:pyridoxamine 5'-phosphate oxidase family protein [Mycobacterium sp.]